MYLTVLPYVPISPFIFSPMVTSPFLHRGPTAQADHLAILHLRRDLLTPTVLRSRDELNEGYDEGKVTNTRFGSFPHSTLIGTPWGSQVRASAVDTGSRGRKEWEGKGKKRKRNELLQQNAQVKPASSPVKDDSAVQKAAVEASTGFVHLLPPTPEVWTTSLPHRTQVVYTPDYSYILHRIRAKPGTRLIEAGAGSGSFTHAAARAVFDGYPDDEETPLTQGLKPTQRGKVWSFEFHEPRAQKLKAEIIEHGFDGIVELTYRDVCADGFTPEAGIPSKMNVNAVFLDLPAPWIALKHLTREANSPLDPNTSTHLCTFSPCIEQVQRTVTTLRQLGWLEIEMVEIAAKRIEVRRERVGLHEEGLRGVNDSPASVDEAVARLREVEGRTRLFHEENAAQQNKTGGDDAVSPTPASVQISKQQRLANIRTNLETRKLYKEGRLIHKAEPELKAHTSYLVFAILPQEWTAEDELKAQEQWRDAVVTDGQNTGPTSKRQMKRAAKMKEVGNKAVETTKQREIQEAT